MNLTEFLLARIAEDEAAAERAAIIRTPNGLAWTAPPPEHGALILSGHRLLAECQAKRRIVGEHATTTVDWHTCRVCDYFGYDGDGPGDRWGCPTIRMLALPYADHPDYDEAWRL